MMIYWIKICKTFIIFISQYFHYFRHGALYTQNWYMRVFVQMYVLIIIWSMCMVLLLLFYNDFKFIIFKKFRKLNKVDITMSFIRLIANFQQDVYLNIITYGLWSLFKIQNVSVQIICILYLCCRLQILYLLIWVLELSRSSPHGYF